MSPREKKLTDKKDKKSDSTPLKQVPLETIKAYYILKPRIPGALIA